MSMTARRTLVAYLGCGQSARGETTEGDYLVVQFFGIAWPRVAGDYC